jgi:hypothetical protein
MSGRTRRLLRAVMGLAALTAAGTALGAESPRFNVDPAWPKQLPNNFILGNVGGITVDTHDHIWVLTRPRTLDKTDMLGTPPTADCCVAAPPVVEFDAAGNYLGGWGGPGDGYQWPENEHGITVDHKSNVWICGNGGKDHQCLKFTRDGRFLLQIGRAGENKGSLDEQNLLRPAQVQVWPATNEVFIADGYGNRRVIVFDADTGKFKRMWGAYGNRPDDAASREQAFAGPAPQQFNLVHGIQISRDGLIYVNDRRNSRIQVFTIEGKFLQEGFVARGTTNTSGTTFSAAFSPDTDQRFIHLADSVNYKIRTLDRRTLAEIPGVAFGHGGPLPGQFQGLHVIATDSKGNIYSSESDFIGRVQKFGARD